MLKEELKLTPYWMSWHLTKNQAACSRGACLSRWAEPEVPSNSSQAAILWTTPFPESCCCHPLPTWVGAHVSGQMGLLGAGIRTHSTLIGSLSCKNTQQSSYWDTADSQTWLQSHTYKAFIDLKVIFKDTLSLSRVTQRKSYAWARPV